MSELMNMRVDRVRKLLGGMNPHIGSSPSDGRPYIQTPLGYEGTSVTIYSTGHDSWADTVDAFVAAVRKRQAETAEAQAFQDAAEERQEAERAAEELANRTPLDWAEALWADAQEMFGAEFIGLVPFASRIVVDLIEATYNDPEALINALDFVQEEVVGTLLEYEDSPLTADVLLVSIDSLIDAVEPLDHDFRTLSEDITNFVDDQIAKHAGDSDD